MQLHLSSALVTLYIRKPKFCHHISLCYGFREAGVRISYLSVPPTNHPRPPSNTGACLLVLNLRIGANCRENFRCIHIFRTCGAIDSLKVKLVFAFVDLHTHTTTRVVSSCARFCAQKRLQVRQRKAGGLWVVNRRGAIFVVDRETTHHCCLFAVGE